MDSDEIHFSLDLRNKKLILRVHWFYEYCSSPIKNILGSRHSLRPQRLDIRRQLEVPDFHVAGLVAVVLGFPPSPH